MIEVEIKLPICEPGSVRVKLSELGFTETEVLRERDTYFDNDRESIRMGGMALRVRETICMETGTSFSQINFKGKKLDQITMTREELETDLGDAETGRKILGAIGYHAVMPEVIKDRRIMKNGGLTACLDSVVGLGDFLELEILAPEEKEKDAALEKIRCILQKLGYDMHDTVRTSYLTMLQKKV